MRHIATILALSLAAVPGGVVACSANIHGNTVNIDAKVSIAATADVDVDAITPGQAVPLKLSADGAVLVAPDQQPSSAQAEAASYFKVFLDDTGGTELVATASTMVSVTIPAKTPEGHHKLICQLYKHDGEPTNQEQSLDINVKAMASATATGNGTASGNASGTASGNTSTGTGTTSGSASGTATGNGTASGSASGSAMTTKKDGGA